MRVRALVLALVVLGVAGCAAIPSTSNRYAPPTGPEVVDEGDANHDAVWHLAFPRPDGSTSDAYVWTPPGWSEENSPSFPVLYLLHGSDGSAEDWLQYAGAADQMNEMLADGTIAPMVVVMPDATTWITEFDPPQDDPYVPEFNDGVVPAVREAFNLTDDPNRTAIAGLSMGAFHALNIVVTTPGEFAAVVPMSGGWDQGVIDTMTASNDDLLADPTLHATLKQTIFYRGNVDDGWGPVTDGTFRAFTAAGLPAEWGGVYADGAHEWSTWSWGLSQAAPQLFHW